MLKLYFTLSTDEAVSSKPMGFEIIKPLPLILRRWCVMVDVIEAEVAGILNFLTLGQYVCFYRKVYFLVYTRTAAEWMRFVNLYKFYNFTQ
jgi:hypothetical protein